MDIHTVLVYVRDGVRIVYAILIAVWTAMAFCGSLSEDLGEPFRATLRLVYGVSIGTVVILAGIAAVDWTFYESPDGNSRFMSA